MENSGESSNTNKNGIEFLKVMEGLVSNDVKTREKNLDSVKEILLSDDIFGGEKGNCYAKIWKSIFFFYWNADKPVYQKKMADKVANLFLDDEMNFNSENYEVWIRTFMLEFIKKWPKIDFHRMDKYIMFTQTILKKYFEVNLQNENFDILLNFFDLVSFCITSGYYNFSFISVILKFISFFIEDVFKNEGEVEAKKKFLEGYFLDFFEKLLKIFIDVKDHRENSSFKDYIFNKIYDKFSTDSSTESIINIADMKGHFVKKLFDFAKSKENIPDNKRKIIYKIYKQMKYNQQEEDDNSNSSNSNGYAKSVNPVYGYIMNKNYTHKLKMSKVDRMKRMIERKKNEKRIQKILQEEEKKKKEKELEKEKQKGNKNEELLEENIVRIDEEESEEENNSDNHKDEDENNSEESGEELEEDEEELEFEEEEYDEGDGDEENGYWKSLLRNSDEEDDMIYSDEEYNDKDDYEEQEENEDDEVELDPRFLYFLVDSGNDALQEISEEDRKIIEAYKNCQKNTQILRPKKKKKKTQLKKQNGEDSNVGVAGIKVGVNNNNSNHNHSHSNSNEIKKVEAANVTSKPLSSNENLNNLTPAKDKEKDNKANNPTKPQSAEKKSSDESKSSINNISLSTASKRKNSVNSQNSNGKSRKKNVIFKFSSNQFNEYDQSKPISLASKSSLKQEAQSKQIKGSLRLNKNKKN